MYDIYTKALIELQDRLASYGQALLDMDSELANIFHSDFINPQYSMKDSHETD